MKRFIAFGLASAIALTAVSPAQARQGCGQGFHRAPNGECRPNRDQQHMWVAGRYYAGHGYWYNNRWWHHRYRDHDRNDWRYR
jgi:hypothetical protein